ncbi:MAG TPA: hypothetical protein V6D47_12085 [Oscillatoriaceae cyanobacterium]
MAQMLTTAPISFGSSYTRAIELYKRYMPVLLTSALVVNLPSVVMSMMAHAAKHSLLLGLALLPIDVVFPFLMLFLWVGLQRLILNLSDGEGGDWQGVFSAGPYFLSSLGAGILMMVLVGIGTILLVIPGLYVAYRLSMTFFLIIDRRLGAVEALKQSWAMTQGRVVQLVLLTLPGGVCALVNLALMPLGALGAIVVAAVGAVAGPFIWLAYVQAYRQLAGGPQDAMAA